MEKVDTKLIELPVKLLFTDLGVDFFIKNKKPMNKFKMPDNSTQYGIALNQYNDKTVKHMISIGYLSRIEISRAEFSSKRKDILSMARSNVFGFLAQRFDEQIFDIVIDSDLIKTWNRANHGSILDRKTNINETVLRQILEKNKDIVKNVKETLTLAAHKYLYSNDSLTEEEIAKQASLCDEYLNGLKPFTWFVLAKFKDAATYDLLIMEISKVLIDFMSRNKIAEYLSLMLMELINSAENRNLKEYIKNMYPTLAYNDILEDPEARIGLLNEMQKRGELFSIGFKFDKSETKISAKRKFEVAVFNKETEIMMLKEKVDQQMASTVRKQSLTDFYRRSGGDGSDLGMFYLSYLGEECSKVGIKFESQVKEISGSGQSYTSLTLTL
ncbi:MAG: hypothetical protein JXR64_01000 [Spirochaetales bacterium]|nr:hypothetical protein [Spirochaetales bacterium]